MTEFAQTRDMQKNFQHEFLGAKIENSLTQHKHFTALPKIGIKKVYPSAGTTPCEWKKLKFPPLDEHT